MCLLFQHQIRRKIPTQEYYLGIIHYRTQAETPTNLLKLKIRIFKETHQEISNIMLMSEIMIMYH